MGDRVAQLLCLAVSAQRDERRGAEQELRQMETQDGFTAHLMALGSSGDLDAQTRWLAVMYLKNQVARFWQCRTAFQISADEKAAIRNGCLPLSLDADEKISTQAALVVARIVRFDYPRVWPDIMPMIAQAVEQNMPSPPLGDNAAGVQVTRVLHYCVKELRCPNSASTGLVAHSKLAVTCKRARARIVYICVHSLSLSLSVCRILSCSYAVSRRQHQAACARPESLLPSSPGLSLPHDAILGGSPRSS